MTEAADRAALETFMSGKIDAITCCGAVVHNPAPGENPVGECPRDTFYLRIHRVKVCHAVLIFSTHAAAQRTCFMKFRTISPQGVCLLLCVDYQEVYHGMP